MPQLALFSSRNLREAVLIGLLLFCCASGFCAQSSGGAPNGGSRIPPARTATPPPSVAPGLSGTPTQQSPSLGQAKGPDATPSPLPAVAPIVPLYKRYPPEMVVVGEVGDVYVLTRHDLETMVGSPIVPGVLAQSAADEFMASEAERQKSKAEEQVLWDWALVKTIALLAKKDGMEVTDAELDAFLAKLDKDMGLPDTEGGYSARIVDAQVFRNDMRDALLADKAILGQVKLMFPEEKRREIYEKSPGRFSAPASMRLWHIYRIIPSGASAEEIGDIRKEFYKTRKKAARAGGRDFEKIALEVNPPIGGKPNSGDMGWIDENTNLGEGVMETLRKLKIGEVSDVLHRKGAETNVAAQAVAGFLQPATQPRFWLASGESFQVYRVTEREEAKGLTYDEYAQQRVLDKLVGEFKLIGGREIMKSAPFPVRLNATGLRLIDEPSKK